MRSVFSIIMTEMKKDDFLLNMMGENELVQNLGFIGSYYEKSKSKICKVMS